MVVYGMFKIGNRVFGLAAIKAVHFKTITYGPGSLHGASYLGIVHEKELC